MEGVEGLRKQEKELIDMDNRVVIAGGKGVDGDGRGYGGDQW